MKKNSLDFRSGDFDSGDLVMYPQLAALAVLYSALEVAETALIAAHPESWNADVVLPEYDPPSKAACYAKALSFQIDALEATLNSYRHTIRWSRDRSSASELRPRSQARRQSVSVESQ
jgi:hypothetical protein